MGLLSITRDYKGLQGITKDYKGATKDYILWITRGYKVLYITKDCSGLLRVTRDDKGLQGMTKDYKGATKDYSGLQGVRRHC